MADDWEDWEDENYEPQVPATVGQAALAKVNEPDASKFAGEDEDLDERPAWENNVPKPQQKKTAARPSYEDRGAVAQQLDQPLDDPVAEKLRKQKCTKAVSGASAARNIAAGVLLKAVRGRLVEDADLRSAQELFDGSEVSLDSFTPKSTKEFEQYGKLVALKYLLPHTKNSGFKSLIKALLREALSTSEVQQVKDVETSLAGIRSDKIKEDKAKQAASKVAGKKKSLNAGPGGGTAGLDDYRYSEALDDEVDFM